MESGHRAQDPRTHFKSLGGGGVEGGGLVPDTVGFGVWGILKLVLASSGQARGLAGPWVGPALLWVAWICRLCDCTSLAFGVCPWSVRLVWRPVPASWRPGPESARWCVGLGLGPLVGLAKSRGVSGVSCGLRRSLGPAHGWGCCSYQLVV